MSHDSAAGRFRIRSRLGNAMQNLRLYHYQVWFTNRGRQVLLGTLVVMLLTRSELLLRGHGYSQGEVLGYSFASIATILHLTGAVVISMTALWMLDFWLDEVHQAGESEAAQGPRGRAAAITDDADQAIDRRRSMTEDLKERDDHE